MHKLRYTYIIRTIDLYVHGCVSLIHVYVYINSYKDTPTHIYIHTSMITCMHTHIHTRTLSHSIYCIIVCPAFHIDYKMNASVSIQLNAEALSHFIYNFAR
jgi:hypothetical protein